MAQTVKKIEVFWNSSNQDDEHWAFRVSVSTERYECDRLDLEPNLRNGGIPDAVVSLAADHHITIESGDVHVDGLYGMWSPVDEATK